jgi:hypothetical protein
VIYAGTSWFNGGVFLSIDSGAHWSLFNNGLPEEDIRSIAIKGTNIFAGYPTRGVYLSTDGANWNQVNNGLSDTNILCLTIYDSTIFAGTVSHGVYLSSNNGSSWSLHSEGFTFVATISGLATNDKYIFAAEDGVWRRRLSEILYSKEINNNDNFNVYPNPAKDIIITNQEKGYLKKNEIAIYNIQNQLIFKQESEKIKTEINITKLTKGLYFLKIENEKEVFVRKFIKE